MSGPETSNTTFAQLPSTPGPQENLGLASAPTERDQRARTALAAARARTRRQWQQWSVILAVIAVIVGAGVFQVWRHAEIRAVTVHPATVQATSLPAQDPPARLRTAWTSPDRLAAGSPLYLDVVVTYGAHTVTGRDTRTGAVRWTYTRSDRTICSVVAQDGAVVAIYRHTDARGHSNCAEVTGLAADSGRRTWVRTLFINGTDIAVSSRPGYLLVSSPSALELIEPTGGLDWWYDEQPADCSTRESVLGSAGVLIASTCTGGDTLSLRALGGSKNRAWSVPLGERRVLSADSALCVLSADARSVVSLNQNSGSVRKTSRLSETVSAPTQPLSIIDAQTSAIVFAVSGGLVAVDPTGTVLWQRAGIGLPVEDGDVLYTAGPGQVLRIDAQKGRTVTTADVAAATPSSSVAVVAGYVVVGGASTTVLH